MSRQNSDLGFCRKLWLTVLQRFCSRFVMVSTQSFDESCDIPNWTTNCFEAADTTDRVITRPGECSWSAVKRATCVNAFPSCSIVSETLADSSYKCQEREVTNGLRTHDNSSGVIATRGLDMDSQSANVDTWKYKVALPHSCSKLAAQLAAYPSENIACDGLLCIDMDRSDELEEVECCFAAVVGLPIPPVIDGGRTHRVANNMAGTGAPSTNTLEIDVVCCSVDGPTRPVSCQITLCWTWNQSDVEEKCKCASLSSVRTTLK